MATNRDFRVKNGLVVDGTGTSSIAGSLGIGTTNPQGNLHVVGATGDAGRIYLSDADDGTGTGDSLLITKSGDHAYIYNRESTGDLRLGAGDNSGWLTIADDGKVGIGDTNPLGAKLHVEQANDTTVYANTNETFRYTMLLRNNTVATNAFSGIAFDVSTESDFDSLSASIAAIRDTSAGSTADNHDANLAFATNDAGDDGLTERMRITHDGNVGIGTTSPESKLEVVAALAPSSATQFTYVETLKLDVEDSGTAEGPAIRFRHGATNDHNAADYMFQVNGDGGNQSAHEYSHNYGYNKWYHAANGDGFKPIMRFRNNGSTAASGTIYGEIDLVSTATAWDVYDGTHTGLHPTTYDLNLKLSAGGNSYFNGGDVGIGTSSPTFTSGGGLHIKNSSQANVRLEENTGEYFDMSMLNGDAYIINRVSDGFLAFRTNSTDRMRILSDGNVGIGTTSPGHKLEVNGSFAATTKSFDIEHPTKEGMRLHHGSLEGPEHGVYIRGRLEGDVVELPDYWLGLVDEDTITVQLTPNRGFQQIYVEDISDNKVYVGTQTDTPIDCFYFIQAERKDVDKMEVEY
jgi:hypothetical protein